MTWTVTAERGPVRTLATLAEARATRDALRAAGVPCWIAPHGHEAPRNRPESAATPEPVHLAPEDLPLLRDTAAGYRDAEAIARRAWLAREAERAG